jgi:hypothetical protein
MVLPGDTGSTFSTLHVAVTAVIALAASLALAGWRLPALSWGERVGIAIVVGLSVFLWRLSANFPQLNEDGLPGFSANDWLCPVVTYVCLGVTAALRPSPDPRRWEQTRALLAVVSLAVNVVTI